MMSSVVFQFCLISAARYTESFKPYFDKCLMDLITNFGHCPTPSHPHLHPICKFLVNSYFTGTAGDSLSLHDGMKFSTKEVDNDIYRENCAQDWRGAWWFRECFHSHLNGEYSGGPHNQEAKGIY